MAYHLLGCSYYLRVRCPGVSGVGRDPQVLVRSLYVRLSLCFLIRAVGLLACGLLAVVLRRLL